MQEAACRFLDPEAADRIFFPPTRKGQRTRNERAREMCEQCPVRVSCFAFAIAYKIPYGTWGGVTEGERQRIARPIKVRIRKAWKQGEALPPPWEWKEVT